MQSANDHQQMLLSNIALNTACKAASDNTFHPPLVTNENKKYACVLGGEEVLSPFADLNKPCLFLFSSSSEEH